MRRDFSFTLIQDKKLINKEGRKRERKEGREGERKEGKKLSRKNGNKKMNYKGNVEKMGNIFPFPVFPTSVQLKKNVSRKKERKKN